MDKVDKKVKEETKCSVRINLHKGLREKQAEAWTRLNLALQKLREYELAADNG